MFRATEKNPGQGPASLRNVLTTGYHYCWRKILELRLPMGILAKAGSDPGESHATH